MNRTTSFNIGDRHGCKVITKDVGVRGRNRWVEVRCDCGAISEAQLSSLKKAKLEHCKRCRRYGRPRLDVIIGARYDRRTVVDHAPKKGIHPQVVVRCDCGTVRVVAFASLTYGRFDGPCKDCPDRTRNGTKERVDRIRELLSRGWKKKAIAEHLGISAPSVSRLLKRTFE